MYHPFLLWCKECIFSLIRCLVAMWGSQCIFCLYASPLKSYKNYAMCLVYLPWLCYLTWWRQGWDSCWCKSNETHWQMYALILTWCWPQSLVLNYWLKSPFFFGNDLKHFQVDDAYGTCSIFLWEWPGTLRLMPTIHALYFFVTASWPNVSYRVFR
jgi:hypothetical protein